MGSRWYVVHAYSGFEKKVAASIREQAEQKGLSDKFEEILVPTEEVVEVRRGAKVSSERKFFPGYVLIKMDMTDETWHLVQNTAKVTGFLGGRGRPSPISDHEAARIMHRFRRGSSGRNPRSPLKSASKCGCAMDLSPRLTDSSRRSMKKRHDSK